MSSYRPQFGQPKFDCGRNGENDNYSAHHDCHSKHHSDHESDNDLGGYYALN